jgi:hypothetical protein
MTRGRTLMQVGHRRGGLVGDRPQLGADAELPLAGTLRHAHAGSMAKRWAVEIGSPASRATSVSE